MWCLKLKCSMIFGSYSQFICLGGYAISYNGKTFESQPNSPRGGGGGGPKPTLSSFPSYVCFLRKPKLYWVETFSPSLVVPPSSLVYLSLRMPTTYSLAHFPFYNALLVGSQWWCFIHLSHGLHFCSRFLIRWGLLLILLKLALDAEWCSADDFPQGTIILIYSGWIWSPAHRGLTG